MSNGSEKGWKGWPRVAVPLPPSVLEKVRAMAEGAHRPLGREVSILVVKAINAEEERRGVVGGGTGGGST